MGGFEAGWFIADKTDIVVFARGYCSQVVQCYSHATRGTKMSAGNYIIKDPYPF